MAMPRLFKEKTMKFPSVASTFSAVLLATALVSPVAADQLPTKEGTADIAKPQFSPYAGRNFPTKVYWGDTHLHTDVSVDAGTMNRIGQEDAYRFARGEEVTTTHGLQAKLSRPLDFLVISDHAEMYGLMPQLLGGNQEILSTETGKRWYDALSAGDKDKTFDTAMEIVRSLSGDEPPIKSDKAVRDAWQNYTALADKYNDPGKFTALIGYEWTAIGGNNLHRNVIFRGDSSVANRTVPFSQFDSKNPEDVWKHLAAFEKETGDEVLAIPHNGNLSNGRMFRVETFDGQPLTKELAAMRAQYEPLVEVTLKTGLKLDKTLGVNPYKFGMIGSTDAHTSLAAVEEENFFGKHSGVEPEPHRWEHVVIEAPDPKFTIKGWQQAAGGYAGVWATENTREAIFDAMKRKETYATTGPRMTVRFFGGWDFDEDDTNTRLPATAGYAKGVPMGGDLSAAPDGKAPTFLVAAAKDPYSGNLDRIQIVKGWMNADGETEEKVYDVVWSDDRKPGADGKLPPVGNTVDVGNATWSNSIGDPEMIAAWEDPDFDPDQRAFYYARVIEIPTPRWTAYEAKRFNVEMPDEVPMTTQERAYTSPIWYSPKG
jgi:hypothetical protein